MHRIPLTPTPPSILIMYLVSHRLPSHTQTTILKQRKPKKQTHQQAAVWCIILNRRTRTMSSADFSALDSQQDSWATKLYVSTYTPIPIPPSQHSFRANTSHSPSQQQLQNSLNQKTNPNHNANMGRGTFSGTHPRIKTKTNHIKGFLQKGKNRRVRISPYTKIRTPIIRL